MKVLTIKEPFATLIKNKVKYIETRSWKTELVKDANEEINLYKVLVTGNMFKSSDSFIPSNNIIFEKQLEQAKEYWEPKFETEEQEIKAEYLFQGKVKILEKIK